MTFTLSVKKIKLIMILNIFNIVILILTIGAGIAQPLDINYPFERLLNNSNPDILTDESQFEWVRYYSSGNAIPQQASAKDLKMDKQGNLYICGFTSNPYFGRNWLTCKYDKMGRLIWATEYKGIFASHNSVFNINIDSFGNAYTFGSTAKDGDSYQSSLIKYNNDGEELWKIDFAGKVIGPTFDENDNFYICSHKAYNNSESDLVTEKYNSDGDKLWEVKFNKPQYDSIASYGIVLDNSQNVYVFGVLRSSHRNNAMIVKYSPDGMEQWLAIYKVPNGVLIYPEESRIDNDGNAYLVGYTSESNSRGYDYITIKYDSSGIEQWVQRYDSGGEGYSGDKCKKTNLDKDGNVYVTGECISDIITIKYDSNGIEQWNHRFEGGGDPTNIELDSSGNVYVIGNNNFNTTIIKYNQEGQIDWSEDPDGVIKDMLIENNNIFLTIDKFDSIRGGYCSLEKWDESGSKLWETFYYNNTPGIGSENLKDIAVDNKGNFILTGYFHNYDFQKDWFTLKYSPDGVVEWIAKYSGPYSDDFTSAVTTDNMGHVYVTGWSDNGDHEYGTTDYVTIKYDNMGEQIWLNRETPSDSLPYLCKTSDIVVDENGYVYVTGIALKLQGKVEGDLYTIKYSMEGEKLWETRFENIGLSSPANVKIACDIDDNIYIVSKYAHSETLLHAGSILVKYSSDGQELWHSIHKDTTSNNVASRTFSLGVYGDIFVTDNHTLIKYNKNGKEEWSQTEDMSSRIVVSDKNGNVFTTGTAGDINYNSDSNIVTMKYNSEGIKKWTQIYDNESHGVDRAIDIDIDDMGNIYITGISYGSSLIPYIITIKYNTSGDIMWIHKYEALAMHVPVGLVLDEQNNVYVGAIVGGDIYSVVMALKYSQGMTSVSSKNEIENKVRLDQNHPNPFNNTTTFRFYLPKNEKVSLIIFNMLGQKVDEVLHETLQCGKHEIQWQANNLSSGIYFYQLVSESFAETKKFLYMR